MQKFPTNATVVLAYLDQLILSGMNYHDSLSFRGKYFYSYNSHLATIDVPNKVLLIDKYIRKYSVTTAKQTTLFLRQVPSNFTIYHIDLSASPEQNLLTYWESIEELIGKYNQARLHKLTYEYTIKNKLAEALSYAAYTSIDKRTKAWKYQHNITKQLFKYQIL